MIAFLDIVVNVLWHVVLIGMLTFAALFLLGVALGFIDFIKDKKNG